MYLEKFEVKVAVRRESVLPAILLTIFVDGSHSKSKNWLDKI